LSARESCNLSVGPKVLLEPKVIEVLLDDLREGGRKEGREGGREGGQRRVMSEQEEGEVA
jgi:hypothetical protein